MKRSDKQAVSRHLEMIISFALFALFVTFLLLYIKPYETNTLSDTIIKSLEESFDEKYSSEISIVFLKIESPGSCSLLDLNNFPVLLSRNILVLDANNNKLDSQKSGDQLIINEHPQAVYLLISEDLPEDGSQCLQETEKTYTIGSVENKKAITHSSIIKYVDEYDADYESLKKQLGIPETIDFVITSGNLASPSFNIPKNTEVIARTYSKDFLSDDGNIIKKDFLFRVW